MSLINVCFFYPWCKHQSNTHIQREKKNLKSPSRDLSATDAKRNFSKKKENNTKGKYLDYTYRWNWEIMNCFPSSSTILSISPSHHVRRHLLWIKLVHVFRSDFLFTIYLFCHTRILTLNYLIKCIVFAPFIISVIDIIIIINIEYITIVMHR